jgi:hypothetical protein
MAVRCATTKNRYRNVLPKWDTRVQLATRNACVVDAPEEEEEHLLGGRHLNGAALATDTGTESTELRCSSALSATSSSGGAGGLAAAVATVAERDLDLGRDHQLLSTYINANYITMKGHASPSYIAAQARLTKLPPFFFHCLAHVAFLSLTVGFPSPSFGRNRILAFGGERVPPARCTVLGAWCTTINHSHPNEHQDSSQPPTVPLSSIGSARDSTTDTAGAGCDPPPCPLFYLAGSYLQSVTLSKHEVWFSAPRPRWRAP